ncbi:MAG TPA: DUF1934 domain-containing protein [Atopostipes sp.]|nr:DUF1934 domain-containing protein [Atopostipes sp.]
MATDKLTQGLPVRVILETTIVQEEEVFKNSFDEMGRIVLMNDNYYLRFKESKGEDDGVVTLIKIDPEGIVHITRHTENKTRLIFNQEEETYTSYATPTGIMQMKVQTNRISSSYNNSPFAGDIEIDYVIYMEDIPLGTYQIRLRFTT